MRIMILLNTCLFIFILLGGAVATAGALPTPAELPGGKIVSLDEAEGMVKSGVLVLDVRSAINYGRGHVPGAILASYRGKSAKRVDFDAAADHASAETVSGYQ